MKRKTRFHPVQDAIELLVPTNGLRESDGISQVMGRPRKPGTYPSPFVLCGRSRFPVVFRWGKEIDLNRLLLDWGCDGKPIVSFGFRRANVNARDMSAASVHRVRQKRQHERTKRPLQESEYARRNVERPGSQGQNGKGRPLADQKGIHLHVAFVLFHKGTGGCKEPQHMSWKRDVEGTEKAKKESHLVSVSSGKECVFREYGTQGFVADQHIAVKRWSLKLIQERGRMQSKQVRQRPFFGAGGGRPVVLHGRNVSSLFTSDVGCLLGGESHRRYLFLFFGSRRGCNHHSFSRLSHRRVLQRRRRLRCCMQRFAMCSFAHRYETQSIGGEVVVFRCVLQAVCFEHARDTLQIGQDMDTRDLCEVVETVLEQGRKIPLPQSKFAFLYSLGASLLLQAKNDLAFHRWRPFVFCPKRGNLGQNIVSLAFVNHPSLLVTPCGRGVGQYVKKNPRTVRPHGGEA
mmetsp:Transcript_5894/g.14020  ORF Transcript_5894/g.14020 Transcript_5894/m.14020 type:complete len:459 (+) Transcript_5894:7086-8462(+)